MNSLSWVIYAVDVVASANIIIAGLVVFVIPGLIFCKMIGLFENSVRKYIDGEFRSVQLGPDRMPFSIKQMAAAWCVLAFVSVIVPGKQTMILIASSEYGEKILNNPKIGEIVDPSIDLLKTWIEKEKKEIEKGDKK